MKKILLISSFAVLLNSPAVARQPDYNLAAVCDFSYARMHEASGRISDEAGNKPGYIKLPAATEGGMPMYRMKNNEMRIDFVIDGAQKKIMALEVYPAGLLAQDAAKKSLLSRLGASGYRPDIFEAGCDALTIKAVFEKERLKYVQMNGFE